MSQSHVSSEGILAVIPSRFASQRLPGKPLVMIQGKPLVQWVYEATIGAKVFRDVVVATDDDRIMKAVDSFGGKCVMTSSDHQTGTDRVAEVARNNPAYKVIVNVQGDQPFVDSTMLRQLVEPFLQDSSVLMTTVACPLRPETLNDPNTVRVVCDRQMNALYFSRAPIPYFRQHVEVPVYHHVGLYAFSRDFLEVYASLTSTPLEQAEQLEQLRAMEHGYRIRVSLIDGHIPEVNTFEDLEMAESLMAKRMLR